MNKWLFICAVLLLGVFVSPLVLAQYVDGRISGVVVCLPRSPAARVQAAVVDPAAMTDAELYSYYKEPENRLHELRRDVQARGWSPRAAGFANSHAVGRLIISVRRRPLLRAQRLFMMMG
jgi:hypothetical protein